MLSHICSSRMNAHSSAGVSGIWRGLEWKGFGGDGSKDAGGRYRDAAQCVEECGICKGRHSHQRTIHDFRRYPISMSVMAVSSGAVSRPGPCASALCHEPHHRCSPAQAACAIIRAAAQCHIGDVDYACRE